MSIHRIKSGVTAALVFLLLLLSGCGMTEQIDPHAGMVCVSDGAGGEMWVKLYEELEVSHLKPSDVEKDGEFISYIGQDLRGMRGVDVSEHQQEVDWQAVKGDGVEFAIIRAGYRGYSEGKLQEDKFFRSNIEGALEAGLKVGVYFFSQAVSVEEAAEEAEFVIQLIRDYDLNLPVFFDWEHIGGEESHRTDNVTGELLTDVCLEFCRVIKESGSKPGVYFYRSLGYNNYELDRLEDLTMWVGAPGDIPDFYYAYSIWQYSYTGTVAGIENKVDLNIMFVPIAKETSDS